MPIIHSVVYSTPEMVVVGNLGVRDNFTLMQLPSVHVKIRGILITGSEVLPSGYEGGMATTFLLLVVYTGHD